MAFARVKNRGQPARFQVVGASKTTRSVTVTEGAYSGCSSSREASKGVRWLHDVELELESDFLVRNSNLISTWDIMNKQE